MATPAGGAAGRSRENAPRSTRGQIEWESVPYVTEAVLCNVYDAFVDQPFSIGS
jgi:hypothetical protein